MQTAPVLAPGQFEAKVQGDIVLNHGGGFDLFPKIRFGLVEHLADLEAFIGTGKTDFQFGILGKYNLLPDLPDQVGLSFIGGFSFLKDNGAAFGNTAGLFTAGVVVSKTMHVEFGTVEPYGALEIESLVGNDVTLVPVTLLTGAKWMPQSTTPWHFYSELGIDVKDSFWSLSFGAGYPF